MLGRAGSHWQRQRIKRSRRAVWPAAPQGRPKAAQAQPLGEPLVDELLQDSFLRRITTQFFAMLHEERGQVQPELAEQASLAHGSTLCMHACMHRLALVVLGAACGGGSQTGG